MRLRSCLLLPAFCLAAMSPTFAAAQIALPTITLDRAVQFMAPDGSDVVLSPGTYPISRIDDSHLRLVNRDDQHFLIAAMKTTHGEAIVSQMAMTVTEEGHDDHLHIVLLLPGGQALDAAGLVSHIQTRGDASSPTSSFTSRQRYAGVLMQQGRVQLDSDFKEPESLSSPADGGSQAPLPHSGRVTLEQGRIQLDAEARRTLRQACKECMKAR